jgi:hypothetical protein
MRVEIRHRNEGTLQRKHFIDLAVIFSEEERRIITIRGLQHVQLDLTPGILASSHFPIPPSIINLAFVSAPLLFLGGCVSTAIRSAQHDGAGFGVLFMLAAVCLFAYAIYARIKLARANITTLSINDFFEQSTRPVLVAPPYAAVTTAELKRRLATLTQVIEQSANLSVEILEL